MEPSASYLLLCSPHLHGCFGLPQFSAFLIIGQTIYISKVPFHRFLQGRKDAGSIYLTPKPSLGLGKHGLRTPLLPTRQGPAFSQA